MHAYGMMACHINTVVAEHRCSIKFYKIKASKTVSALNERFVCLPKTPITCLHVRYMQAFPDSVEPFWQTRTSKQGIFFVCLQYITYHCG